MTRHTAITSWIILLALSSCTISITAALPSHGITNLQTSLSSHRGGGSVTTKKNPHSQSLTFVNGGGGQSSTYTNTNSNSNSNTIHDALQENAVVVDVDADNHDEVAAAATALASPPLRISTAQNGNEIEIKAINPLTPRKLKRLERRAKRMAKKKQRQEEKSHLTFAKGLKNRNTLNLKRKVLHAGFGFFFATLNHVLPKQIFMPGMIALTTSTLAMECLRYRQGFGWINKVLHFFLGGTLRKHEMEGKFTGSFYYFLGVTITAAIFPSSCASLGICQLALADPSASYFGRQTRHIYWSRIENGFFGIGRNKGVLGFLGGALVCLPFNFYVLSIAKFSTALSPTRASIAAASLVLGLAGAFADLCVPTPALCMPKTICGVPMLPFHVDDNVVVPIFSGFACTKLFQHLGWSAGVDLAKFIVF